MARSAHAWHQRWPYLLGIGCLWILIVVGPWRRGWIDGSLGSHPRHATVRRLHEHANIDLSEGPLRVGIGEATFTDLAIGRPLAGYGKRCFTPCSEVNDPVGCQVLVLDNSRARVALITFDLLLANRVLVAAVEDALRRRGAYWDREELFFTASHTHSGPAGFAGRALEMLGLGMMDPKLTEQLAGRIAQAIIDAEGRAQPSELAHVSVDVPDTLVRNRTVADDPANRTLDLFSFQTVSDHEPLATLALFSAHATAHHSSDRRISSDYPGVLRRELRKRVGGPVLFASAAVGSMAPGESVSRDKLAEHMGKTLAEAAADALKKSTVSYRHDVSLATVGFEAKLPAPTLKVGASWRLSPLTGGMLVPSDAWVHCLRLGDSILAGTPADYSGVLAQELRHQAKDLEVVVTSFNGDYVGYVLPDSYDDVPKYEAKSVSVLGPTAGSFFQEVVARSVTRLREAKMGTNTAKVAGKASIHHD
ncbi:Neutral ceramidase precursor [Planctomycetes bacterium Pan216]|uniref:Neutral ceramidase n=1 Tax=Kolteria novifilia TaxID=2527975 RepID=A0A518BAS8_9BACT|nr:Neutral ceramidase precursor [Planctomycetes bacterium Pan216]